MFGFFFVNAETVFSSYPMIIQLKFTYLFRKSFLREEIAPFIITFIYSLPWQKNQVALAMELAASFNFV